MRKGRLPPRVSSCGRTAAMDSTTTNQLFVASVSVDHCRRRHRGCVSLPCVGIDDARRSRQGFQDSTQLNAQRANARAIDEGVPQALSGYRPTLSVTGSVGRDLCQPHDKNALAPPECRAGLRGFCRCLPAVCARCHRHPDSIQWFSDPGSGGRKLGVRRPRSPAGHRADGSPECSHSLYGCTA
jgi:hypothetical protein